MQKQNGLQEKKTDELTVRLDFGGTQREFTHEEIAELAKKAYSYEQISGDWDRVKTMALSEGKSVCEYLDSLSEIRINKRRSELLEKGADEQLISYILDLEKEKMSTDKGFFDEVSEYFPKIKDISDIPECVVESARVKGSRLVDELLRYRHKKQMEISILKDLEKSAINSSIGPQREHISADIDPAKLQFIKGIWGK